MLFAFAFFGCVSFDSFRKLLGLRSGRVLSGSRFLGVYVDNVPRADLCALSAGLALIVVDDRVVVFHVDGVEGTFLFALLAAYAASFAYVCGRFALIAGGASHYDSGL